MSRFHRDPDTSAEIRKAVNGCVFCAIINGTADATIVRSWTDAIAIEPLNPVVPGHLIVLPAIHVADAAADPDVTAFTMYRAAQLAAAVGGDMNLITSIGPAASQTVMHLHVHLVPRTVGDGLTLPWTTAGA